MRAHLHDQAQNATSESHLSCSCSDAHVHARRRPLSRSLSLSPSTDPVSILSSLRFPIPADLARDPSLPPFNPHAHARTPISATPGRPNQSTANQSPRSHHACSMRQARSTPVRRASFSESGLWTQSPRRRVGWGPGGRVCGVSEDVTEAQLICWSEQNSYSTDLSAVHWSLPLDISLQK